MPALPAGTVVGGHVLRARGVTHRTAAQTGLGEVTAPAPGLLSRYDGALYVAVTVGAFHFPAHVNRVIEEVDRTHPRRPIGLGDDVRLVTVGADFTGRHQIVGAHLRGLGGLVAVTTLHLHVLDVHGVVELAVGLGRALSTGEEQDESGGKQQPL